MTTDILSCPSCGAELPAGAHFCLNCGTPTPTEPGVPARTMPTGAIEVSRIRSALADRYRIERVLGEGGMATVYLAHDLKHDRKVAVKVMRPELAATLGSERFLREIAIAARLSHPHILAVHDSGNADGVLYYVMPLVEGESLPSRLKREKQLPVADALRIAREVAEALAYAHQQGIVHRDIKPANILLSAGHALVADFGIARATGDDVRALTQTGLAIGTPQYMSPEQASGDPNVDGRTDVYALGAVLYEMLAGEPPFTGPTAQAIITRSITEEPRPLKNTRASLPPAVNTAVLTSLAKSPADRYANAGAMVTALVAAEDQTRSGSGAVFARQGGGFKPWQMAAAAAVALLIGVLGWKAFANGGGTAARIRSVAVLPFENQGTADEAYFADGIVDELRDKLARLDGLTVIASASADQYRDSPKTGTQIADELNVDQVLTGKVRWGEGEGGVKRVRVTAELVDGKSGAVTWRNSFDADLTDALVLQGRIASDVAAALGAVLSPRAAEGLAGAPTANVDAYQLYLMALTTPASVRDVKANIANLDQAVALDANFARAWIRLSDQLVALYAGGNRSQQIIDRTHAALAQALRLAPDSAATHVAASYAYRIMDADSARSRTEIQRAWQLDSNNVAVLRASAGLDMRDESFAAGFAKLSRARALDPRSVEVLSQLLNAQLYLGMLDDALVTGEELMALRPADVGMIQSVVLGYLASGDTVGARRTIDAAKEWTPTVALVAQFAGYQELAYLLTDEERALLYRLPASAFDNDVAWWGQSLALAAYQQGDTVRARAYADSSLAESQRQAEAAPGDPQLTALYADMLMLTGDRQEAVVQAENALTKARAKALSSDIEYSALQAIRVYGGLGMVDRALDLTASLLGNGRTIVTRQRLGVDPMWRAYKGNPRFERMVAGGISSPVD